MADPVEPVPCIVWVDDECAGATCGCGYEDLLLGTSCPTRCPECGRIFELYQETRIVERVEADVNMCPHCGATRGDGSEFCTACQRFSSGETMREMLMKIEEERGHAQ